MLLRIGEAVVIFTIESQYGESDRGIGLCIYILLRADRCYQISVQLGRCPVFLEIELVRAVIRYADRCILLDLSVLCELLGKRLVQSKVHLSVTVFARTRVEEVELGIHVEPVRRYYPAAGVAA